MTSFFEYHIGGRWCGVKFGLPAGGGPQPAARPLSFCQAVGTPSGWPIHLTREVMICPGGIRSLGWGDGDQALAEAMRVKFAMCPEIAESIVRQTPKLDYDVAGVTVGTLETPDVLISYAQPEAAMRMLQKWQSLIGMPLVVEVSGFMSVCGAVAVKAFLRDCTCLSFGCPDARKKGGIGRDRLVIGLPLREAQGMARNIDG